MNGADWWRIRYQIAHEVFHWLCTPPGVLHWTHELFAVEMARRAMIELGELDYAERSMAMLSHEAERLSVDEMLTSPLVLPYPDGLHGRAWTTGRELIEAIGWEPLKPLAFTLDDDGRPSISAWMQTLSPAERASVALVLGYPSPAWV